MDTLLTLCIMGVCPPFAIAWLMLALAHGSPGYATAYLRFKLGLSTEPPTPRRKR